MRRKNPFYIDGIYHVYNRGVAKCSICKDEVDRWRFIQGLCLFNDTDSTNSILWRLERNRGRISMNVLKEYLVKQAGARTPLVRIMAYCLMGNHYHLLLEEIREGGITKFMHKLGGGYAGYFNRKHDRVGSLFQNAFKSVLVDNESYLQYLLVYINVLNPAEFIEPQWKEKGIQDTEAVLRYAKKHFWGSHLDYLGERGSLILDKGILQDLLPTPREYLELVKSTLEERKYLDISHLVLE